MTIPRFQKTILSWYKKHRRNLPWRRTKDPYKILVSEIMLQQTQVSRVLPKYKEFLTAFPTIQTLAKAQNKKLLRAWTGLGYWKRARFLKETAKKIVKRAKTASFPRDPKELETLPGIGPYTARALACFAFGNTEAFLDTNIRRVYLHFFFSFRRGSGQANKKISDKEILPIAQKALASILCHGKELMHPMVTPREWHYALFDYGATMLKDKNINRRSRHYHKQSGFKGSFRSFRTAAVRFLLARPHGKATGKQLVLFLQNLLAKVEPLHRYTPEHIIDSLLKDRLIKKAKYYYTL